MERIGIAASKMAQGSLLKYNFFVVGISCLFSLIIFLISGFSLLVGLLLISLILRAFVPSEFTHNWIGVVKVSMGALAVLIGALNILAIIKNIKVGKSKL